MAKVPNGSGNIFADFGFRMAEHELRKAVVTLEIHKVIGDRERTKVEAEDILRIKLSHVALLMRNAIIESGGGAPGMRVL